MRIFKVKENRAYYYSDLFEYLDDDSINRLISLKMLKKSKADDLSDLEDLLYEDLPDLPTLNTPIYTFEFVGIVGIKDIYLISYPKYIKNVNIDYDKDFKVLRELIAVITKYLYKKQSVPLFNSDKEEECFNLLSFTLDLLNSYLHDGLYINDVCTIDINGPGDILWEKTIAEQPVYFSNDIPIYLDLYTQSKDINYQDFVRQIHACILTETTQKLSNILSILGFDDLFLSDHLLSDFGDIDYITYRLKQEYIQQFETHKQELILKLINYINKSKQQYYNSDITFITTTSMNKVWEDVCSVVYKNDYNKTLEELSLIHPTNESTNQTLKDLMPKPLWKHISGTEHELKDSMILDLIVIENNEIKIYDAKYYNLYFDEEKVKNQPKIEDITKQYLYQKAYIPLAKKNNLKIKKNAFLFPTDGDEELFLGQASINLFKEDDLSPIDIILLPVRKMFKKYLAI